MLLSLYLLSDMNPSGDVPASKARSAGELEQSLNHTINDVQLSHCVLDRVVCKTNPSYNQHTCIVPAT